MRTCGSDWRRVVTPGRSGNLRNPDRLAQLIQPKAAQSIDRLVKHGISLPGFYEAQAQVERRGVGVGAEACQLDSAASGIAFHDGPQRFDHCGAPMTTALLRCID